MPKRKGRKSGKRRKTSTKKKKMLINVIEPEVIRIAILQDSHLDELYVERTASAKYLGNIYKGRVVHIEKGIQAAFVDLGEQTNGFLHVSDTVESWNRDRKSDNKKSDSKNSRSRKGRSNKSHRLYIQDIVKKGQEILVQVTKESVGTKAPTVTSCISLPGRYLVLFPYLSRIGVSKKIVDEKERGRLKKILHSMDCPNNMGVIARTAAADQSKKDLERDLNYLLKLWNVARRKSKKERTPSLIFQESDLVIKTIRDIYSQDIKEIIIDEEEVYHKVKDFLKMFLPRHRRVVKYYDKDEPLFYAYKIEKDIDEMLKRKVELSNGGSIVIDQTEAMVAIDVNTGKFKGERNLEETAYKTNMQAAKDIARQIRLRDLGGLVVCDFIDMHQDRHRRDVERTLREELKMDRAKTKVAKMSRFCMIELTRQRLRPSLNSTLYVTCPHCEGTGIVKTIDSMGVNLVRQIKQHLAKNDLENVSLRLNPELATYLQNARRETIYKLEKQYNKPIVIRADSSFKIQEYKFE